MNFEITTLGTASALPMANRFPSAHLLNVHGRLFLIDCGEGCQMQLRRYNFSLLKIDNIFISHAHGDHIFGLFGLLSTFAMLGRTNDLHIYAPSVLEDILAFFHKYFGDGLKYNVIHHKLEMKEPLPIYESKSLVVSAFPLKHRVPTFGFLFKEKEPAQNVHKEMIEPNNLTLYEIARLKEGKQVVRESGEILDPALFTYKPYHGRSFAYCSDTLPFKKLIKWIEGVDLLYHEATFADDMAKMAKTTHHTTGLQVGEIAQQAQVKRLVIGHFSSRYPNTDTILEEARLSFPNTDAAKEGMKFEVPLLR